MPFDTLLYHPNFIQTRENSDLWLLRALRIYALPEVIGNANHPPLLERRTVPNLPQGGLVSEN